MSPSAICQSQFTRLEKMNSCSNRCLIAVTSMAVRLSARFRVEDPLLSRTSYKLVASAITGLLCCFSQNDSASIRLSHGSRNRAQKHLGDFQHVQRFHVSLRFTSKGNCAQHVYIKTSSSQPWSSLLQNHPRFACQQR